MVGVKWGQGGGTVMGLDGHFQANRCYNKAFPNKPVRNDDGKGFVGNAVLGMPRSTVAMYSLVHFLFEIVVRQFGVVVQTSSMSLR